MAWTEDRKRDMFAANVTGTFTILEATVKAGIRRLVFASSGELYPELRPRARPITEEHPLEPLSPRPLSGSRVPPGRPRAGAARR
ncbi:NAD-dependent epimerase/dehydratase family protein [Falsiroseomonas sp. HW251]|uniref:NAD-dependent epimerase/dehydratase family protein n=1 Tax=Falsiroseomonas sp. HW251 TaxID=3390998 RepID=UPI003D31D002